MYHVYTEKNYSEITRTLIGDYTDYDEAMDAAEKQSKAKKV